MATDFSTYLQQPDVKLGCYLYIEGIPYIFSNIASPGWDLGDYTWSQTFRWFGPTENNDSSTRFESISSSIDLLGGVTVSGEVTLEFVVDPTDSTDIWQAMLFPSDAAIGHIVSRGGTHPEVVIPTDETLRILTQLSLSTPFVADEDLFIGTETVGIRASIGSNDYTVTRGKYDSRRQTYRLGVEHTPVEYQSVIRVSNAPQTWRNRIVSVYLVACSTDQSGALVPLDSVRSEPNGDTATYSRQLFRGPVSDVEWQPGMTSFKMNAQSIEQLLEAPAISRATRLKPGPINAPPGGGWVYLESGINDMLAWNAGPTYYVDRYNTLTGGVPLYSSNTVSITAELGGDGLYNTDEVMQGVLSMLNGSSGMHESHNYFYLFDGGLSVVSDKYVMTVREYDSGAGTWSHIEEPFTIHMRPDSVLIALGQTEDLVFPEVAPGIDIGRPDSALTATGVELQEFPFVYHLHKHNTRLYYHGDGTQSQFMDVPPRDQGTVNVNGGLVDSTRIRIGKREISEVEFYHPEDAGIEEGYRYATLINRGITGTDIEDWAIPLGKQEDPKNDIVIGLYFDNHDILDILRYLAVSNGRFIADGGYDVLPYGYGAAIPSDYFDHDAFDVAQMETGARAGGWWLEEEDSLRKLFRMVGRAYQITFFPAVVDGKYVISCRTAQPPMLADSDTWHIDLDWYNPLTHAVTADKAERDVVNRISWEFAYDPLTRKYLGSDNNSQHHGSIKVYGPSRAVKIQLPWILDTVGATNIAIGLTYRIFEELAEPPVRYEVDLVNHESWAIGVKDKVEFTHAFLPDWSAGGLGFSQKLVEVEHKADAYGPGIGSTSRVTLVERRASQGVNYFPYTPCLRLVRNITGNEYEVSVDQNDGGFSRVGTTDLSHWADAVTGSWLLTVYRDYNEPDFDLTLQLSAINTTTGTVTFDGALDAGWSTDDVDNGHVIVTFVPYNSPTTDSQAGYTYYASAAAGLIKSGVEVPPRRWY